VGLKDDLRREILSSSNDQRVTLKSGNVVVVRELGYGELMEFYAAKADAEERRAELEAELGALEDRLEALEPGSDDADLLARIESLEGELDHHGNEDVYAMQMVALCCATEDGEQVFSVDEAEELSKASPPLFKRLVNAMNVANKDTFSMTEDATTDTEEVDPLSEGNGASASEQRKKSIRSRRKKRKR
jgi:hypothetical protein